MLKTESTLATVWLMVLRLVELHGIDPQQLLQEIGVRPETLRDVCARLPGRLADVAFTRAAAQIPDPAFALRAGECWHPSNLGTMGYAWLSSRTLHTGMKRMERFARILGSRFSYLCVDEPAGVRFVYDHGRNEAPVGHLMTDFTLSILLDMCRTNFGSKLNAAALRLRRPEPANPQPWQDLFGCQVQFGATEDSVLFDREAAFGFAAVNDDGRAVRLDEHEHLERGNGQVGVALLPQVSAAGGIAEHFDDERGVLLIVIG